MVKISIIISLVLLACFVSGRKLCREHERFHSKFSISFPANNQVRRDAALSDESLLGRVERDAGKRRARKMRGKKGGNNRGEKRRKKRKEMKKSKEKKESRRQLKQKCARQSGIKY